MKTLCRTGQVSPECELDLPQDVVDALGLDPDTVLHAAMLPKRTPSNGQDEVPDHTFAALVASPLPSTCWARMVRICFTVGTGPGSMGELLDGLQDLGLYARHLESQEGLHLVDRTVEWRSEMTRPASTVGMLPSAIVWLEIPYAIYTSGKSEGALKAGLRSLPKDYPEKNRESICKGVRESIERREDALWIHGRLRHVIKSWHQGKSPDVDRLRERLCEALQKGVNGGPGMGDRLERVEWISPLRTLNAIAGGAEMPVVAPRHDCAEPLTLRWRRKRKSVSGRTPASAESRRRTRSYFDEQRPSYRAGHCLTLSLRPYQRILDPGIRRTVRGATTKSEVDVGAVLSVDTTERILIVHFVKLDTHAIAQFDLVVPAAGLEHRWWSALFSLTREFNGCVLGLRSESRMADRWGTMRVLAAFPFAKRNSDGTVDEPDFKYVSDIVHCFHLLRGKVPALDSEIPPDEDCAEPKVAEFENLWERTKIREERARTAFHCLPANRALEATAPDGVRDHSLLRHVRIWYRWPGHPDDQKYRAQFARNPFNFTKPLTLEDYKKLLRARRLESINSRIRLAQRIRERLEFDPDGNVLLVGAHRSGKTSILNMVVELLNSPVPPSATHEEDSAVVTGHAKNGEGMQDDPTGGALTRVLAIEVNAAVTPPQALLSEIVRQVAQARLPEEVENAESGGVLSAAGRLFRAARKFPAWFKNVFGGHATADLEIALPLFMKLNVATSHEPMSFTECVQELTGESEKSDAAQKYIRHYESWARRDTPEVRARYLKYSLMLLKEMLDGAAQADESGGGHATTPIRLVVAMDEIKDSAGWGGEWAFAAWRHAIESPDFDAIRWLFASSQPLDDVVSYSPLSNALREYNLSPLVPEEAQALLSNFERDADGTGKLCPTITSGARALIALITGRFPYLMQVTCTHVHEQAICYHVPVITEKVVERAVEHRALADLGDYFWSQWKRLDPDHQSAIQEVARSLPAPLRLSRKTWRGRKLRLDASVQKALSRAGLGDDEIETGVVPLFVRWLTERSDRSEGSSA